MQMTNREPVCKIYLANVAHYLVDDAAELLGVHRRTVIRWMDDEDGPLSRIVYDGRRICVPADEVERLMADGDRPGGGNSSPPNKPGDGPPRRGERT